MWTDTHICLTKILTKVKNIILIPERSLRLHSSKSTSPHTTGNYCSGFFHHRSVLLLLKLGWDGIICYMPFCVQLLLLHVVFWDWSVFCKHMPEVHSFLLLSSIPYHSLFNRCLLKNLWHVSISHYYEWSCYEHCHTRFGMNITSHFYRQNAPKGQMVVTCLLL